MRKKTKTKTKESSLARFQARRHQTGSRHRWEPLHSYWVTESAHRDMFACLLLQVIGSDEGPAGGKSLTKTTFIQRLNTKGGSAPANPATGCLASNDVGHQVLVPYSADYFFFRNEQ